MNLNLKGKQALVCGSSQGIGAAIAYALAENGATIHCLARNKEKLESVCTELPTPTSQTHHYWAINLNEPEAVEHAMHHILSTHGVVEILINNTGGPAPGPAHTAELAAYTQAFQQHLIANQMLLQNLLPGMRQTNYGRVINIISTSVKQPIPGLGVSNTIRGAVAQWAKTIATELAPDGITVNNVLPGMTETERLQKLLAHKAQQQNKNRDEIEQEEKEKIPMRRFATAEEVASAVAFLASPAAAYITGINLPVDGGRTGCL